MSQQLDNTTINIDRLWISSLRGFDPRDIKFKGIGTIKRESLYPTKYEHERRYRIISINETMGLDYELLNGRVANGGYLITDDGYETKRYLTFVGACLGQEPPRNPNDLSFTEAAKIYGENEIMIRYKMLKKAHDRGLEAIARFPNIIDSKNNRV